MSDTSFSIIPATKTPETKNGDHDDVDHQMGGTVVYRRKRKFSLAGSDDMEQATGKAAKEDDQRVMVEETDEDNHSKTDRETSLDMDVESVRRVKPQNGKHKFLEESGHGYAIQSITTEDLAPAAEEEEFPAAEEKGSPAAVPASSGGRRRRRKRTTSAPSVAEEGFPAAAEEAAEEATAVAGDEDHLRGRFCYDESGFCDDRECELCGGDDKALAAEETDDNDDQSETRLHTSMEVRAMQQEDLPAVAKEAPTPAVAEEALSATNETTAVSEEDFARPSKEARPNEDAVGTTPHSVRQEKGLPANENETRTDPAEVATDEKEVKTRTDPASADRLVVSSQTKLSFMVASCLSEGQCERADSAPASLLTRVSAHLGSTAGVTVSVPLLAENLVSDKTAADAAACHWADVERLGLRETTRVYCIYSSVPLDSTALRVNYVLFVKSFVKKAANLKRVVNIKSIWENVDAEGGVAISGIICSYDHPEFSIYTLL